MIFKNFKCPNGAPPDECIHMQQIINNISNYFIKKAELKNELKRDMINNSRNEHQQSQDKTRTRTRG